MPIIDIQPPSILTPRASPPQGAAPPLGADDINHGSDSPTERVAWSPTVSWQDNGEDTLANMAGTSGTMQWPDAGTATARNNSALNVAFRQGNTIGSFYSREDRESPTYREPGYNPWDAIKGTPYEANWASFVNVHNPVHEAAVKRQIDMEREDRRLLEALPWYQRIPAELAAGIVDLPTLIPGGAFVRGVGGTISIGRTALNTALAGGVSGLAQEAALQSTQELRPLSESTLNVGASVLLSGLLGAGGAKLLSKAEWNHGVNALQRELAGDVPTEGVGVPTSAGAAANLPADIEGNSIAGRAAAATAAATARLNPLLRSLHSPSAAWREISGNLFENPIYLKKNFDRDTTFVHPDTGEVTTIPLPTGATSQSAETLMKEWNAGLGRAIIGTNEAFPEYRKAGGQMNRLEFREAVGRAMRRNDEDADPFVAKVAKQWRSEVFDPLKDAAIKAKLLPDGVAVEEAASYFSRMWNRNRLIAQEDTFKNIVRHWVGENLPRWTQQFDAATERKLDPLRREIDDLEMAKLRRASEQEARARGDVVDAGDFSEGDIRQALRIVQGGAAKPKDVQTLTQFVHAAGGVVDFGGELASLGITNKARPGFVKKERKRFQSDGGGWSLDDMARHAWESGFMPEFKDRPTVNDFLEVLRDDFFKTRAVVRQGDRGAFQLHDLVARLEDDLSRIGVDTNSKSAPRFSTSQEVRGMVERVHRAMDAEADQRIAKLKAALTEREGLRAQERDANFVGDPHEMGNSIADEVFNSLTGRHAEGSVRPEFITVKARGPLKERTFHIPDTYTAPGHGSIENFLEHDVEEVGRRYNRIMGADVELANKFGSPDMLEQIQKIRDDYAQMRALAKTEKERTALGKREESDVKDLENMRDILRGSSIFHHPVEKSYATMVRNLNHINYLRSMGEVSLASLSETVRPAMVHGLMPFMGFMGNLATNLKAIKLSRHEAQLAGNVYETVLGHRLATLAEVVDPYASRGPVESFLQNMTNVASKWNGIRLLTDMQKSASAVLSQNRILDVAGRFTGAKGADRAFLRWAGIDESMAGRIAQQFEAHGETMRGVKVANTQEWTDPVAVRAFRAAMNKDIDSIITTKGVADVPTFANTPTGRSVLQFKSFFLASHQRVLLRGLQEPQARFMGGLIAMVGIGMMATYLKALSGNREEKLADFATNPGWWIAEGLDKAGIFSVPMELSNMFEKASGFNPIKSPIKVFDQGSRLSQRNQNRNEIGSWLGPSIGTGQDLLTAAGIPKRMVSGEEITSGQKNAAERLIPFNSYVGMRQLLRYLVNPPPGH